MVTTRSPSERADDTAGVEGGAHRRQVLGRIGLTERPADGATVADDRIGDHLLGVAEDREGGRQLVGLEQLTVTGHGTDAELVAFDPDVPELVVQIVDVDQVLGRREPQLHHRQEAVASGDEPGLAPEPLQQRDRVIDAGGTFVFERCWHLHGFPLLPWCRHLGSPTMRASKRT